MSERPSESVLGWAADAVGARTRARRMATRKWPTGDERALLGRCGGSQHAGRTRRVAGFR
jgi:hypothetical protein